MGQRNDPSSGCPDSKVRNVRYYRLRERPSRSFVANWQNAGYNQPPHPSFYIGTGMDEPPTPNVEPITTDES